MTDLEIQQQIDGLRYGLRELICAQQDKKTKLPLELYEKTFAQFQRLIANFEEVLVRRQHD